MKEASIYDVEEAFGGSAIGGKDVIRPEDTLVTESPFNFVDLDEGLKVVVNDHLNSKGINGKVSDILIFHEKGGVTNRDQVLMALRLANRSLMWKSDYPKLKKNVLKSSGTGNEYLTSIKTIEESGIDFINGITLKEEAHESVVFRESTIVFMKDEDMRSYDYALVKKMAIKEANKILKTFGVDLIPELD